MAQYKLKQLTIVNGNPYHAGVYEEEYLPDAIKNDPNLIEQPDQNVTLPDYQSLQTQSIEIGAATPNSEQISYSGQPAKVITEEKKSKTSPVAINTATAEEIAALDGVSLANAQKIVEERAKSEFTDFADLDKRVALKGNRKWESFGDRLILKSDA